jgi:cyclic lactone autoinducer peptide
MTNKIKLIFLSSAAALSLLSVKLFASFALSAACLTHQVACTILIYQPKEPASLKKYFKN